jgi:hypothetical protein
LHGGEGCSLRRLRLGLGHRLGLSLGGQLGLLLGHQGLRPGGARRAAHEGVAERRQSRHDVHWQQAVKPRRLLNDHHFYNLVVLCSRQIPKCWQWPKATVNEQCWPASFGPAVVNVITKKVKRISCLFVWLEVKRNFIELENYLLFKPKLTFFA